jgi:regulatory factor X
VTQALNTVLTNQKQLAEMRRSWQKVDFESVRNQSALVCNCRHEDLVQLLEVEFVGMLESLTKSTEPVREVMTWADKCCERLMGSSRANHGGSEERSTMSSRSVLIRWGYVTSQVMRDLVRFQCSLDCSLLIVRSDDSQRSCFWSIPDYEAFLRVSAV